MYAHPSFMRNNPDALIELRKVSASTGAMLSHSLTQRQGASAESTRFGESLATCNDVNVNKPSELPRRSVSPSHSSTCSTGSPCSSPVVAMDNSKLFFPSREIYDMGRRTIGADSSASSLAEGNGLSIQTSSQPHRQNQRPNVVPPCPIPLLNHNVSGAYDKKVMSGGDRGRLDLLALALEYECFKSCALKMENKI